jgi:hypothetical protein
MNGHDCRERHTTSDFLATGACPEYPVTSRYNHENPTFVPPLVTNGVVFSGQVTAGQTVYIQ